jgi:hypothetical protein
VTVVVDGVANVVVDKSGTDALLERTREVGRDRECLVINTCVSVRSTITFIVTLTWPEESWVGDATVKPKRPASEPAVARTATITEVRIVMMVVVATQACKVREESEFVELLVDGRWAYVDLHITMRRGEEAVLHRDLLASLQPSGGNCIV